MARGDEELEKDVKAIDQGGPSREFFYQLWKQMPTLKVSYKRNGVSVALFEEARAGLVPQKDEQVDEAIKKMVKEAKNLSKAARSGIPEYVRKKIKAMYRAFGRIMARCMLGLDHRSADAFQDDAYYKFLISAKALPIFYRNGKSVPDIKTES